MKKPSQLTLIAEPEHQTEPFRAYAFVELFGHARIVGMLTVEPPEFPGLVRVDVPDLLKDGAIARKGFTRYVGKAAIYGVTPIDEEAVRALLPEIDGRPHRPMRFDRGDC